MTEIEIRRLQEACGALSSLLSEALRKSFIAPHLVTPNWVKSAQLAVHEADELLGRTHTTSNMVWSQKERPEQDHGRMPL